MPKIKCRAQINVPHSMKKGIYAPILEGCPGTTCQARATLILGLPEQMSQVAYLLMMENNQANLGVMVRQKFDLQV